MNLNTVEATERLAERVAQEQDEVLGALQLVRGDFVLEARLFDQLVDLMVEGLFLDLRRQYLDADLDHARYRAELTVLADHCREAGLLPLPSRDG